MQLKYGATIGETVPIKCYLVADPPVTEFRWWRSDISGKTKTIPSKVIDQKNSSFSVIYHK